MIKKFKAVIIDDEELARSDLKAILSKHPSVELLGEADSIASAVELIEQTHPNLIFLDIQFPGESGFDLLEHIDTKAKIVFVTAFDEHAIHAFEVNALDYLLKPVNPGRLDLTLERLGEVNEPHENGVRRINLDESLFLEINNKYNFLKINNIIKITASGNYSEIITSTGLKGLTVKSMKEWENRLPENTFIRIHRSTIINIDYVEKVEPWFNNSYCVYLKGFEKPDVISRRYIAIIKDKMI
jgi:two-component system, LytTR family, response regulator